MSAQTTVKKPSGTPPIRRLAKRLWQDRYMHLLVLPALIWLIVFAYTPMYGLTIAFKKYNVRLGIMGSPWIGTTYFQQFFESIYFGRLIRNTVLLSVYSVLFSFPVPIIFSLLLNEIPFRRYRNTLQTVSYYPNFVSTVIVVGILRLMVNLDYGIINKFIKVFGGEAIAFMDSDRWFRPLYIITSIWQSFGWNSIIYLAALVGVSPELHEAASIDGANRFQRVFHISLPTIAPTIIIMLLLSLSGIMNVGSDKVLLMYNPGIYETSDIISTYVHRQGIESGNFSFATAVGLFNSVINFLLIVVFNRIARGVSEVSLW